MRRLIALGVVLLAGCADNPVSPAAGGGPGVAASRGAAIAQRDCAACHGLTADGATRNPAAPDFAAIKLGRNALSLERVLGEIATRGHGEMVRRALSSADVEDLAAYIEAMPPKP